MSVDGNRSSFSLATGSTIRDDRVLNIDATPRDPRAPLSKSLNMSTYGGFFKTLSDTYECTLHMDYGAIGYQLQNQGALANQYLNTSDNLRELERSLSFRDPTDDILADMRELMFRTALRSAQAVDMQQVTTLGVTFLLQQLVLRPFVTRLTRTSAENPTTLPCSNQTTASLLSQSCSHSWVGWPLSRHSLDGGILGDQSA